MKTFLLIVLFAIIAYVVYAVACTIKCVKLDEERKKLLEEMNIRIFTERQPVIQSKTGIEFVFVLQLKSLSDVTNFSFLAYE